MFKIVFRIILLIALLSSLFVLRWPTLKEGKPFFYHEDEAHHFNRTVEMVKRGTLNPEYFHKPSLHFYLRMPAVLLGSWLADASFDVESVQKIRTKDHYGLARYAFSWSHPLVVYAVRGVSLVLTMLTILLVYIVARQLGVSTTCSFFALTLIAVSPELFNYSSYIGVDVPLMFFCLLATACALYATQSLTIRRLWVVGLIAGLAVSCKYNGLPIALLPLGLIFLKGSWKKPSYLLGALFAPSIGFFIGSPYILVSFPLFWEHLSYEIWHYAVAGHEGQSAEPGLAQVIHYGRWLMSDGIGAAATVLAAFGAGILLRAHRSRGSLFLLFPILFATLMCAQKTNFVRNMLPILPYCAILAAYTLDRALLRISIPALCQTLLAIPLILLCILPPLERTLDLRAEVLTNKDSRVELEAWINENQAQAEIAIFGNLQPQYSLKTRPGLTVVPANTPIDQLFQSGFDFLVAAIGTEKIDTENDLTNGTISSIEQIKTISGSALPMRIVKNPALVVYKLIAKATLTDNPDQYPTLDLTSTPSQSSNSESYQWLTKRISTLKLPAPAAGEIELNLTLELMSPWKDQEINLFGNNFRQTILLNQQDTGQWLKTEIKIPLQGLLKDGTVLCVVNKISSPNSRQLSGDERRLGLALKSTSH
jgi:hypothetical protein